MELIIQAVISYIDSERAPKWHLFTFVKKEITISEFLASLMDEDAYFLHVTYVSRTNLIMAYVYRLILAIKTLEKCKSYCTSFCMSHL